MDIKTYHNQDYLAIRITGELDTTTTPGLEATLSKESEVNPINYVIDLSETEYISSVGLRVPLATLKKQKPKAGECRQPDLTTKRKKCLAWPPSLPFSRFIQT